MGFMRTKTTRDRGTRYPQHQINSILEQFTQSGLPVRRFALQHDLCPATLSRWVRLHRPKSVSGRRPRFIEVQASSVVSGSTMAEIRLGDGLTVHLSSNLQVSRLAELIQLLRRP